MSFVGTQSALDENILIDLNPYHGSPSNSNKMVGLETLPLGEVGEQARLSSARISQIQVKPYEGQKKRKMML